MTEREIHGTTLVSGSAEGVKKPWELRRQGRGQAQMELEQLLLLCLDEAQDKMGTILKIQQLIDNAVENRVG